jgi:glycosyltransferase involved in cell wall biosynthesis
VRILYLTDNDSVHNSRFLEKLIDAGHEVWTWNLTATQMSTKQFPDGVKVVVSTKQVDRGASPSYYRELLPQLQSVLKEVRPSLIHAGPIQSAAYLAALADFHPTLVMSWGSDLLMDAERNEEWRQATEFTLQGADALFCDCDTVRQKASEFRTFTDSPVVQFPWGIKQGEFSPSGSVPNIERFRREPGTTTFIYTRSYDPLYGPGVLLQGFLEARQKNPSLRLLLVGAGSQDESILNFVREHNLEKVITVAGPQPAKDLPSWFRAADVYISCAKSDGTSISLLEAMATGLPVIVTDIPSNREWVTEPDNGWLAESGSVDSVARKMACAASLTFKERQKISDSNRRIVSERADWDQNFHLLFDVYDQLTSGKRARASS